jgi:hypothetical protein
MSPRAFATTLIHERGPVRAGIVIIGPKGGPGI